LRVGVMRGIVATDGPEIDLGWEPQWLLIKEAGPTTGRWILLDTMRGLSVGASGAGVSKALYAHVSDAEVTDDLLNINPRGFQILNAGGDINTSGSTYIYIAIRRGPMRAPTSGTEVFAMDNPQSLQTDPGFISGFPVDLGIFKLKSSVTSWYWTNRVAGEGRYLESDTATAEQVTSSAAMDYNNGWWDGINNTGAMSWMFRRAPGFFDAVAYSGNNVDQRQVPHNLSAPPEFIITKTRNVTDSWICYHTGLTVQNFSGADYADTIVLNSSVAEFQGLAFRDSTAQTEDYMTLGFGGTGTNESGKNYIAYLFATLPGVSKVGSYTGNGSSQTINCGFTSGARFVLIKKSSGTGDWWVFDTARGIVSGNDPALNLNTTSAEDSNYDMIDPDGSGFIVTTAGYDMNASGDTYIFLAIA
jgi:hypothetical protein